MNQPVVTVDVREDLRCGREPFAKIMSAVGHSRPEQKLRLIAPFKPAPLIFLLAKQGFEHHCARTNSGDWEVIFQRRADAPAAFVPPERPPCAPPGTHSTEIIDLDARGLEPPQPLVKILEALESLPAGAELCAHTERRPMHLYDQLAERGFVGETEEQNHGHYVTRIRRR